MKTERFIEYMYKNRNYESDREIAQFLSTTDSQLSNWKRRNKTLSDREIHGLISRVRRDARKNAIEPIVEFFPLDTVESKSGTKWELFSTDKSASRLSRELRDTLQEKQGIYIFYDTRGRALYAGKTKQQSLWKEMKDVFNRERRETQRVYRVKHPTRNQKFRTAAETPRLIARTEVLLADMATYFSAYAIASEMIDSLEAFVVRAFANDLLNSRMERFPPN